jgi:hypothetical protein
MQQQMDAANHSEQRPPPVEFRPMSAGGFTATGVGVRQKGVVRVEARKGASSWHQSTRLGNETKQGEKSLGI